ncbi:MAG: type II secretion system protein [Cyanobacteria bacterium SIG32]|nr:type II secretion system protein [Cyanobacteria bacterium SIG32]
MKKTVKNLITWSPSHLITSPKSAFTLAEVLITLAIIGVVAAMTIPTLISDYQEKQTITALKKNYAIFNEAFRLAYAENGDISTWGFSELNHIENEDGSRDYDTEENLESGKLLFDKIKPYLKLVKTCEPYSADCMAPVEGTATKDYTIPYYSGILNNGTSFYLFGRDPNCAYVNDNANLAKPNPTKTLCADLTIDINGKDKGENYWGKDVFRFSITQNGIFPRGIQSDDGFPFESYCHPLDGNRSTYGEACTGWVIENSNMDYLHCSDLSWDDKRKCD